jgi:REP element-mobilizing transposase RayT|uniref:Transposase IS200-like domain-containing protein n=1 Tax=candidate division WOR-3 bacterium TaxID=2052148 RepID=A0A7V3VUD4_UNCW3
MPKRIIKPGSIYYIWTITKDCVEIFSDPHWARFLLLSIGYHRYMLNYNIFGYLIMPESFYIIIQPGRMFNVSKIMKLIKGNFARKYNEVKKREGTVWAQSFDAEIVENMAQLKEHLDYIHNLPVSRGLVKDPGEYEFSSYNNYSRARRTTIQLVIDPLPEDFK